MPPSVPYAVVIKTKDETLRYDLRVRLVQDAKLLGTKETARRWGVSRNTARF